MIVRMTSDRITAESLSSLIPSWRRSLRSQRKSPRTIQSYEEAARQFLDHVKSTEEVRTIGRAEIETWLESLHDAGRSPSTVANRYRSLQRLFAWLEDEREITESPFRRMKPPAIPEQRTDVFKEAELRRLFAACDGTSFVDRRNTALLRVLMSTGARVGEVAGLKLEDVDLDAETALVTGKGDRARVLPLTPKTVTDLDRYLRVREEHAHASIPYLWLGERGRVRESGIAQILRRLGERAEVENVHPHRFRHTYAHEWLAAGGQEGDLMRLAGWRSREMLQRYGASAADERARDAHARMSPGESIG